VRGERDAGGSAPGLRPQLPAIGRLALHFLAAYVVVQAVFLGMAELAARIVYPDVRSVDVGLALALHQHAAPALTVLFLGLTILGSGLANVLLTAALAWLLARRRLPILASMLVLVMLGGWSLEFVTKLVLHRARPEYLRLAAATGYSFPSGHALEATCLYGALALALWPLVRRPWQRVGLVALATLMPLSIGLSRVYLGVHYPSDVLGGWVGGLLWLAATRLAVRACERQRGP